MKPPQKLVLKRLLSDARLITVLVEAAAATVEAATAAAIKTTAITIIALRLGTGYVNRNRFAFEIGVVQCVDCLLPLGIVRHLDEAEAAGTTRLAIRNDVGRRYLAILGE